VIWSRPSFDAEERPAENAVLEAVSNVIVAHLRRSAQASVGRSAAPVLV